jgi:hypothetical protein
LLQVPSHVHVTVRTDAQSSIGGINRGRGWRWSSCERNKTFALPQRARVVQAVRTGMKCIRAVVEQREGAVVLRHVKAHSGLGDLHSVGNERADALANLARLEVAGAPGLVDRGLFGQERVDMRVDKISVTGSFRGALLRAAYSRQLAGLQSGTRTAADEDACTTTADDHRQSAMVRRNGRRVTAWCDAARRSHHPEMLKFATEMLATWLPTEATVLVRRQHSDNDGRGGSCKLCGAEEETVVHAMGHCAARWPAAARASSVQHAVQLLREWGVACVPTGPTAPDRVRIAAWFDPSAETVLEICRKVPPGVLGSGHMTLLTDSWESPRRSWTRSSNGLTLLGHAHVRIWAPHSTAKHFSRTHC